MLHLVLSNEYIKIPLYCDSLNDYNESNFERGRNKEDHNEEFRHEGLHCIRKQNVKRILSYDLPIWKSVL